MRVLRWLAIGLAAVIFCAVVIGVVARFTDGPLGPFPGGPLKSGELVRDAASSWLQYADVREIELQLLTPPRSRTTWLLVHNGQAYVPCALPTFRLFKQWPHELLQDRRVVVRIDGERYERQAVRVTDPEEWRALAALSQAKYGHGAPSYPDDVWYFRLEPREAG